MPISANAMQQTRVLQVYIPAWFFAMASKWWHTITTSYGMEPKNILHNRRSESLVDDMNWEKFFLLGRATHHPHLAEFVHD